MAEKLFQFIANPGVRRDGTALESDFYSDSVWVRWQRGKPRKMGGYRVMSQLANGPVRSVLVDSRNGNNNIHYFSQWGVQRQQFSATGAGGGLEIRTPPSLVPNAKYTWSQAVMTSSTGGNYSALLAAATPDLDDITSDAVGNVYTGSMSDASILTPMADNTSLGVGGLLKISGGVTVLQPFPVVYGSAGLIRIGNANDLSGDTWTVGGSSLANTANVAGTKFVYGTPVRGGGNAPAGLFWALDALVRVSFNASNIKTLWQYDTLSQPTSIMSKKGIVEHDGKYFWPGTDRFLMYNGVVQELPNQMNCNWFFDNLNYVWRNKVWGTKIARYGEIWWFYPRGSDTECNDAVIFNYIENTWYDARRTRSAGGQVQMFQYPIWTGGEDKYDSTVLTVGLALVTTAITALANATLTFAATPGMAVNMQVTGAGVAAGAKVSSFTGTTVVMSAVSTAAIPIGAPIAFSSMTAPFLPGDVVTGGTSGARGTVVRAAQVAVNVVNVTGTFVSGETITGPHGSAVLQTGPYKQELDSAYQHEFGVDKIIGQDVLAIPASFTSKQFGFAVGAPFTEQPATEDIMTRIGRLELDFAQVQPLNFTVLGRSFPQDADRVLETKNVQPADSFVEFKTQERILSVKVESNAVGGNFEQGAISVRLSPGDVRSSKKTSKTGEL